MTRDPLNLIGKVLENRYRVEALVGEGGSAFVYRAEHLQVGPVALKFLYTLCNEDSALHDAILADFLQEGRLISELSARTSAIVQARDFGVFRESGPPIPYLVLEWLPGRSLDEVLVGETNAGKPPRNLGEAINLLEPVAEALSLAHTRNVVHRDVKPENMLVVEDGAGQRIKLLDFGIAKVMERKFAGLHHTGTSATAFTPHYGAPEQFSKTFGETGPWTDVFGMALVVLEVMRGGQRAFQGDDYMELAKQSCDEEQRPTPHFLKLDVSAAVEAVFQRALAVPSNLRYESMSEFWSALRGAAFQHLVPTLLLPQGAVRPASVRPAASEQPSPALAKPSGTAGATANDAKKLPVATLVVAGAVVIGLSIVAVSAFQKSRSSETVPGAASSPQPAPSGGASTTTAPSAASAGASASTPLTTPALCPPDSALIPGGSFTMGSDAPGVRGAAPSHRVNVDAHCLDRHEISVERYRECVAASGCQAPKLKSAPPPGRCNFEAAANQPMNCVTWEEANTFCAWRGGRLPSEAEFEHAATRGSQLPWGDEADVSRANLDGTDGFADTAPIGSFPSGVSREGVHDLIGNVAEWQADFFASYTEEEKLNPKGPSTGDKRVVRGGSFGGLLLTSGGKPPLSAAHREAVTPSEARPTIGFRCASALKR
jgi:formylglycine-generating enzyme required for sulfatase activity